MNFALILILAGLGTTASAARKDSAKEKPPLVSILGKDWNSYLADVLKRSKIVEHKTDDVDGHEDYIFQEKAFRVFVSSGRIDQLEVWADHPEYAGLLGNFKFGATIKQLEKEYGSAAYVSRSGREGQYTFGWLVGDYIIIESGDAWGNTTDAHRYWAFKKGYLPKGYRSRLGQSFTLQDLADGKKFDGRKDELPANHSVEPPAAR